MAGIHEPEPERSDPVTGSVEVAPFRLGYRPALDGVRAVAVSMVVAVHAAYLLVPTLAGASCPAGSLGSTSSWCSVAF